MSTQQLCFVETIGDSELIVSEKRPERSWSVVEPWQVVADPCVFDSPVEVYPRPNGEVYICGIGGSDYIQKDELKQGAFRDVCEPNKARIDAAKGAFGEMSTLYKQKGELERAQACMRPCPPDALPYMGKIPGFNGAYINAGHNCW